MSCLSSPSSKSIHSRRESRRRRIQDLNVPCLSPSRQREVELWRMNQNILDAPIFNSNHSDTSPPSPTSSAVFDLNMTPSTSAPHTRQPHILNPSDRRPDPPSPSYLDRLRFLALAELQKSVVETGEGFVDKMRDWETHRQWDATADKGLEHPSPIEARGAADDSDDVMILDSPQADEKVHFWGHRKKRASSTDVEDSPNAAPSDGTPSATTDDDDTESYSCDSISAVPFTHPPSYPSIPLDKAVSALTIALANGACGLNDYQAVLDAYNCTHYREESQVGELWN